MGSKTKNTQKVEQNRRSRGSAHGVIPKRGENIQLQLSVHPLHICYSFIVIPPSAKWLKYLVSQRLRFEFLSHSPRKKKYSNLMSLTPTGKNKSDFLQTTQPSTSIAPRKICRSPNTPVPPRNLLNLYLMLWVTLHRTCPVHWFQSCMYHIVTKHNRTCKSNLLVCI